MTGMTAVAAMLTINAPAISAGEKDLKPFDEVTKDTTKIDGLFTLYRDKEKLLAQIPKAGLGKNYLTAVSISGGPRYAGFQMGTGVIRWERRDKKLLIVEPDLRYKTGDGTTVADVIKRTYTDRIIDVVDILSETQQGDPLIDLGSVFKKDYAGIAELFGGGKFDPGLSRWASVKNFPENLELEVEAAIMKGDEGMRAGIHYSISSLHDTDYKPRRADERIGYFMTARKDYGKKQNEKTLFDRYIHRWRLEKLDPELELSPVKKPIVFYVEKSVPVPYRRWVIEGILEWNKAFEKCGYLDAVQVRQQGATVEEFSDLDPEDVRYNFFRWIVSGRAFAMGPSRVNPITGEILDADILFDDAMVRAQLNRYGLYAPESPATPSDPALEAFLDANPQWRFQGVTDQLAATLGGPSHDDAREPAAERILAEKGYPQCDYAQGMMQQVALGQAVLAAAGRGNVYDEFIGQIIKEIVAHEVGHTLGLRHNFKGSSWLPMEEIARKSNEPRPISGSVMDYNPATFAERGKDQPDYVSQCIGPYDLWAIEYGYRPVEEPIKTEDELLKSVLSRAGESGLAYATDEDTGFTAPDPLVNRYDNGSDPIAYAQTQMRLVLSLLRDVDGWALKDGESYYRLRRAFDLLLSEYGRVAVFVARNVGGMYINRQYKGDKTDQPPMVIVPAEKQRQSLRFLCDNVLSDGAFNFPPELLNKLAAGRWEHWDSDAFDQIQEYPVHDRIAAVQYGSLFHLLNPFTVNRIYDAQMHTPDDQDLLTLPELFRSVTDSVWSELDQSGGADKTWTNRQPWISSVRRNLQRQYLRLMVEIVLSDAGRTLPADAHAVTRMALGQLGAKIDGALSRSATVDDYTRAHLTESKAMIEKALAAEYRL